MKPDACGLDEFKQLLDTVEQLDTLESLNLSNIDMGLRNGSVAENPRVIVLCPVGALVRLPRMMSKYDCIIGAARPK